jgi:hypothetical protein
MDPAKVQKLFGLTSGKYRKYRKQAKILRRFFKTQQVS